MLSSTLLSVDASHEQILGIKFFNGTAAQAVERAINGGLVVAPSGTCFERFVHDPEYRRAILGADVVLPDSGLMVLAWRFLRGGTIQRISGLVYLKQLFMQPSLRSETGTLWILPNERSREKLLAWSLTHDSAMKADDCYLAPIYGENVQDHTLVERAEAQRPKHVVIAIGAGAQEKLGLFLHENLSFNPVIHCIGGALGFITGDQVAIPHWADSFYLGWFFRLLSQPRVFIPRLWKARVLPHLIWSYGPASPPLRLPSPTSEL